LSQLTYSSFSRIAKHTLHLIPTRESDINNITNWHNPVNQSHPSPVILFSILKIVIMETSKIKTIAATLILIAMLSTSCKSNDRDKIDGNYPNQLSEPSEAVPSDTLEQNRTQPPINDMDTLSPKTDKMVPPKP
jgi:hypothetical protein